MKDHLGLGSLRSVSGQLRWIETGQYGACITGNIDDFLSSSADGSSLLGAVQRQAIALSRPAFVKVKRPQNELARWCEVRPRNGDVNSIGVDVVGRHKLPGFPDI